MSSHPGRCFCGAVEIEASGAPAATGLCHCESCRTWLGAPVHGFTPGSGETLPE